MKGTQRNFEDSNDSETWSVLLLLGGFVDFLLDFFKCFGNIRTASGLVDGL